MRPMKMLTYTALAIVGALVVYQFGFKKSAEDIALSKLEALQAQIDARGDGSWLLFDDPKLVGKTVVIPNVQYQDGERAFIFQAAEVSASVMGSETADIEASDVELIPNTGSPLYISSAIATGVDIKDSPITFDQLVLNHMNVEGSITSRDNAILNIEQVFLNEVNEKKVGSIVFENVKLNSDRLPQGFEVDHYQLTDIARADLVGDLETIKSGQIPLTIFPLDNPKIAEGLSALATQSLAEGESGEIANDLLGLFSKHAPQELRDLLGNPTNEELGQQLEQFNQLSPEDKVIGGLELLLKGLKSQQE